MKQKVFCNQPKEILTKPGSQFTRQEFCYNQAHQRALDYYNKLSQQNYNYLLDNEKKVKVYQQHLVQQRIQKIKQQQQIKAVLTMQMKNKKDNIQKSKKDLDYIALFNAVKSHPIDKSPQYYQQLKQSKSRQQRRMLVDQISENKVNKRISRILELENDRRRNAATAMQIMRDKQQASTERQRRIQMFMKDQMDQSQTKLLKNEQSSNRRLMARYRTVSLSTNNKKSSSNHYFQQQKKRIAQKPLFTPYSSSRSLVSTPTSSKSKLNISQNLQDLDGVIKNLMKLEKKKLEKFTISEYKNKFKRAQSVRKTQSKQLPILTDQSESFRFFNNVSPLFTNPSERLPTIF